MKRSANRQFPLTPRTGLLLAWLLTLSLLCHAAPAATPSGLAELGGISAKLDCAALVHVNLSAAVGAQTKVLQATTKTARTGPVCVVQGNIAPHIRFEAHLPVHGWTQRYVQVGCGGLCGILQVRVDHAEECQPFHDGHLATASTDMGHHESSMGDGSFGDDPSLRIDFAYRGVHLTAVAVKALIARYYGQAARYSYFSGCSDGGREALMEAQRFPNDFDGIAAGAAAMNFEAQNSFYHAWMARSNIDNQGHAILTADKLPLLHAAALAECDALDGLKDGQITDPRRCRFDPGVLQCKLGVADTSACLTTAQVETVRKFYAGPHDTQGHRFTMGSVQVGSELEWRGVFVPETPDGPIMSTGIATQALQHLIFAQNPAPGFTLADFHFDTATFARLAAMHGLYDATNPDLSGFLAHDGKLLLWHGWADPHISPLNSIAYYEAVKQRLGADTGQSVRLFLFPGMGHCGGGDGPNQFDILTPLMIWVENNHAPERIVAGRPSTSMHDLPPLPPGAKGLPPRPSDAKSPPHGAMPPPSLDPQGPQPVNRTRPIFPYPLVARYTGKGDINDASDFVATQPDDVPALPSWLGQSFYSPGFQKACVDDHGQLACH
jgi:feruloyl esterase